MQFEAWCRCKELMQSYFTYIIFTLLFSYSLHAQQINEFDNSFLYTYNAGQIHDQHYKPRPDVLYSGESNGMSHFLRKDGISYQLYRIDSLLKKEKFHGIEGKRKHDVYSITVYRTDLNWIGINNDFTIEERGKSSYYHNYYSPLSQNGITKVRSFKEIAYKDLYNGIDLKYYNNNGSLEYDYVVAPGADVNEIKWTIEGADEIQINEKGQLLVSTPLGTIVEEAPIAYQGENQIDAKWKLENNELGFDVSDYNPCVELIIDPVVRAWGTYFGKSGAENKIKGTTDDSSNVYITGSTNSLFGFATAGSHQTTYGGGWDDAFLVKFNEDGNLIWATFYGGKQDEAGHDCATDGNYNIYMCGITQSDSSISTLSGHQSTKSGGNDAFLVKFNGEGIRQWATYYGGSGTDGGSACLAVGLNVYLAGGTASDSNIATTAAFQTARGGQTDGFLVMFNSNGVRQWGTYFGDSDIESISDIVVDLSNNLYLCGGTLSGNLATAGAHQSSNNGFSDAFLAKFKPNGMRLWSTFYGGLNFDNAVGCAVDNASSIYMTGKTNSSNSISTPGSHQSSLKNLYDAYLVKFDSSGQRQWATYYGGDSIDEGYHCFADAASNVFITGLTESDSNISTIGSHQYLKSNWSDAFLVKINSSGVREWGTYYGGSSNDFGTFCTATPLGKIFLSGKTDSNTPSSSIATQGSHQSNLLGGRDAFLVKFNQCQHVYDTINASACNLYHSPSGKFYTESGTYIDTLPMEDGCDSILTILLTMNTVDSTVTQNRDTLTSNALWVYYQWLDCDSNFKVLTGDTNYRFIAPRNGSYAVIVSEDSCIDTSACFSVTGIGIHEFRNISNLLIYPNPTKGAINIQSPQITHGKVRLLTIHGKEIYKCQLAGNGQSRIILPPSISNGIYFVKIESMNRNYIKRIVVQRD